MADEAGFDGVVIALSKPIPAHGADISEIRCRKPTGGDMMAVGNPVTFNAFAEDPSKTIQVDPSVMGRMISRLAGIPTSSVERMEPQEFMSLAWRLSVFFIPGGSTP